MRAAVGALVAAAAVLAWPSAARAESPEMPDPLYHNLRYTDDFSHPDPNKKPDIWDQIKFIPIAQSALGRSYLTLGGELRERFETYRNPNFGIKAPASDAYLLERLQIDADLHVSDYFRAFAQLGDQRRFGNRGVTSTTDVNAFDLMQGFVDLRLPTPLGDAPTLRAGREELLLGFQRLIAVREGPNVRRAFQGVDAFDQWGDFKLDVFSVRPINDNPNAFSDVASPTQQLNGVYATLPIGSPLKTDIYWLGYENDSAKYRGVSGIEKRQTVGARLFGGYDGFDWNFEAASQTGTFGSHDIRAYLLAGIAGFTFEDTVWTPRIAVEANVASGDNAQSSTIGTFNAMYPRLPYFAETPLLVPANVKDVRPLVKFNPLEDVQAVLGYDMLWRSSTTDGVYGSDMSLFAGTNGKNVTGSRLGDELSADVRWRVDQHLNLGAIWAEMWVGPAVQQALGKNVTFVVLYAKYRF